MVVALFAKTILIYRGMALAIASVHVTAEGLALYAQNAEMAHNTVVIFPPALFP